MKPWHKLSKTGKIRRLKEENKNLKEQIESFRSQVNHAAGATQDMAAHSRAREVQNAALRLQGRGISVFSDPSANSKLAMSVEVPALKPATKKTIASQPVKITA